MNSENARRHEFEGFVLDAEKKILRRAGKIVSLPPKAVEMLLVLVKNRGEVVSKAELLAEIWGETFVEESVLTNNVWLLRKMLKELAGAGDLIQTVPRRGYRFGESGENSKFVLEHHVFEQTLIEKSTETVLQIPAAVTKNRKIKRTQIYTFAAFLILTFGGFAFWRWNQTDAKTNLPQIKSIAVLPLKPIGANDADKVLSVGLADALITRLGASRQIVVRPLSSVSQYSDREFDALAVGRELQTDAVLEGTFQRLENRLRVNARLLGVADGKQIWAQTFDQTEADLFRLQDQISKEAAIALIADFNQAERDLIFKRYTENAAAYQAYQRGRYLYFGRGERKGNLEKSVAEFEQAIKLDENYALAYTGLADAYARQANDTSDAQERIRLYELAKQAAQKAVALDPNLGEAYASLGWINRIYDWNWTESEANFKRSIELAPNNWNHHRLYAYLLITLGRTTEAVEVNRRAKQLNPLQNDGWVLYCNRQFEESAAESAKKIRISNDPDARHDLAAADTQLGKAAEAIEILEQAAPEDRAGFKIRTVLAIAYYRSGNRRKAAEILSALENEAAEKDGRYVRLAAVYSEMNLTGKAVDALQKGFEARDDRLMWINADIRFDVVREDERFQKILRQMHLDNSN